MRPDMVIDGKGRMIYASILMSDDRDQADAFLSDNQIAKQLLSATTTTSTKVFDIYCYNDDMDNDYVYQIDWQEILPSTWSVVVLYDGTTTVSSGFTTTVPAKDFFRMEATITIPASQTAGTMGSVVFKCQEDGNETNMDSCAAFVGTWIAEYADVEKMYEAIVEDGSLFPSGATYDSATGIGELLKVANEVVYQYVADPWSTRARNQEIARSYVCTLVAKMLLEKTAAYAYRGAGIWTGSIAAMMAELRHLESRL